MAKAYNTKNALLMMVSVLVGLQLLKTWSKPHLLIVKILHSDQILLRIKNRVPNCQVLLSVVETVKPRLQ